MHGHLTGSLSRSTATAPRAESRSETASMTILLIDDSAPVREVLRVALHSEGYAVIEAANGRESVAAFREHQPAVTIVDILVPKRDGIETVREILAINPAAVVFSMSGADDDYQEVAGMLGAKRGFRKPIVLKELIAAVDVELRPAALFDRMASGDLTAPEVEAAFAPSVATRGPDRLFAGETLLGTCTYTSLDWPHYCYDFTPTPEFERFRFLDVTGVRDRSEMIARSEQLDLRLVLHDGTTHRLRWVTIQGNRLVVREGAIRRDGQDA
jgi:CheY-like chemotaxis protein